MGGGGGKVGGYNFCWVHRTTDIGRSLIFRCVVDGEGIFWCMENGGEGSEYDTKIYI